MLIHCILFQHQTSLGGQCGICGDAYDVPRTSEAGGKFANGIITARWLKGSTVGVSVQVGLNMDISTYLYYNKVKRITKGDNI